MYYLGFDIGGSGLKAVIVKNKEIIDTKVQDLPDTFDELIEMIVRFKECFVKKLAGKKIGGAGFSFAGAMDANRNNMVFSANITYLNNQPIKKILRKALSSIPIKIQHDVECFLVAESKIGMAKDIKNAFYMTVGTGIGSALMINGKIFSGQNGSAGEFGHIIIDSSKHTCLEHVAANKLIKKKLKIGFSEARRRAVAGDKDAIRIFDQIGKNVGIGIVNIINVIDPGVIIISGGLSNARRFIMPQIEEAIQNYVISSHAKKTPILFSKLGRYGGALGAALLFD